VTSYYAYPQSRAFRDVKSWLTRTVEPSDMPVTVNEVARALKLGTLTDDDELELNDLIPVAVDMVERDSQRALARQTWALYMDEFPCEEIELRKPPVISVSSVTYTDLDGDSQTVSASLYDTDLKSSPARIWPAASSTGWPTAKEMPNAVTVTFVAGYPASVPRVAYQAIMLAMDALYNKRCVGDGYWHFIDRLKWEGGL
jgi:uncharacterized phiE125 gp8 family phage protein